MAVDLGRSAATSALTEHRRNHGYILLLLAYYVIVRRAFRVHSLALIVVSFLVGSLFSSKSESIVDDAIFFDLEMFELRPDKNDADRFQSKLIIHLLISKKYCKRECNSRVWYQKALLIFYRMALSRRSAIEKYKPRSVTIYVTLCLKSSFGSVTFCDFKMICLP
jgi:hypothetical protein